MYVEGVTHKIDQISRKVVKKYDYMLILHFIICLCNNIFAVKVRHGVWLFRKRLQNLLIEVITLLKWAAYFKFLETPGK